MAFDLPNLKTRKDTIYVSFLIKAIVIRGCRLRTLGAVLVPISEIGEIVPILQKVCSHNTNMFSIENTCCEETFDATKSTPYKANQDLRLKLSYMIKGVNAPKIIFVKHNDNMLDNEIRMMSHYSINLENLDDVRSKIVVTKAYGASPKDLYKHLEAHEYGDYYLYNDLKEEYNGN